MAKINHPERHCFGECPAHRARHDLRVKLETLLDQTRIIKPWNGFCPDAGDYRCEVPDICGRANACHRFGTDQQLNMAFPEAEAALKEELFKNAAQLIEGLSNDD